MCFGRKKRPVAAFENRYNPAGPAAYNDPEYMKSITEGYTSSGIPKRKGVFKGGPANPNAFGGIKYMDGGAFGSSSMGDTVV